MSMIKSNMTFCSVNLNMCHALVLVETFMRCHQVNFLTTVLHFGHILAITNMNEQPCPTDFILQQQCKMRQRGKNFFTTLTGLLSQMMALKHFAQLPLHFGGSEFVSL